MLVPLKGFIFLCKFEGPKGFSGVKVPAGRRNGTGQRDRFSASGESTFSFLREAKQSVLTGGAEYESENYLILH